MSTITYLHRGDRIPHARVCGDVDVVRFLVECRVNVNARDQHGRSVLRFARYSRTPEITNMLVKAGAKAF